MSTCVVLVTCGGHVWISSYSGLQESAKERHSLTIVVVTKGFMKDGGSKGEFRGSKVGGPKVHFWYGKEGVHTGATKS